MATTKNGTKTVEITRKLEAFISDALHDKVHAANSTIKSALAAHGDSLDEVRDCEICFDDVNDAFHARKMAFERAELMDPNWKAE